MPNDPLLKDLSMIQINWILSNIQNDSEIMKNEIDKISRKPGTSVVQAKTSDADFEAMVQENLKKIKKFKKIGK